MTDIEVIEAALNKMKEQNEAAYSEPHVSMLSDTVSIMTKALNQILNYNGCHTCHECAPCGYGVYLSSGMANEALKQAADKLTISSKV